MLLRVSQSIDVRFTIASCASKPERMPMATDERRWKILAKKLAEQRELGKLGVIAASTGIAEYKLHDLAKLSEESDYIPVSQHDLGKLWKYFEEKKS
jgi:hypothetical protein